MALKFSSSRRYAPEYEGNRDLSEDEQISVTLNRLTVRDMFAVQKRIRESKKVGQGTKGADEETVELDMNDPEIIEEFWDLVEELLVKYTNSWKGVENEAQTVEDTQGVIDLCGPENMPLMVEVFNELLGFSQGSEDLAKNSTPDSEPESLESGSTVEAASTTGNNGREIAGAPMSPEMETSQSSTISEATPS